MPVSLSHSLARPHSGSASGSSPFSAAIPSLRSFCLWLLICLLCAFGAQSSWAQPAMVQGAAAIPGSTQITLKWDAVSGTNIVYDVYQSTDAGSDGSIVTSPNTTSVSRTGLTNGTTYYFKVRARNSSGNGPLSAQVIVTPIPAPVVSDRVVGDNSVMLKWGEVPGASSYDVLRNLYGTSDPFVEVGNVTSVTGTTTYSYTDTNVTNLTRYQYRIRVSNPTANPNLISAIVGAMPLKTPTLSAVPGNRAVTFVSAEAAPNVSGVQYDLYRSTTAGILGDLAAHTNTANFTFTTVLTNGTTYYFTLQPLTGLGTPAASNQVACTPINPPVLSAPILGDNSVGLEWTAVVPNPTDTGTTIPVHYEIYRAPEGGSFPLTYLDTTSNTTYTDTTALNETTYKYKIRAANPDSNSYLDSASLNAKPMSPLVLNDPVPGVGQVSLSWAPVPGATIYRVYQSEIPNQLGLVVAGPTGTSVLRSGLANGTTYYFQVQARNATGSGILSIQKSAMPLAMPTAVSPVTAVAGDGQIKLSFAAIANASSYRIYRSTTSNSYDYNTPTLTATGTGAVTATDTGLTNGTTYYYVVRTVNTSGVSASSTQVSSVPVAAPILDPAVQGDNSIALSWSATTGATAYEVYRAGSATSFGSTPLATINTPTNPLPTTYTDSTAVNGTAYFYKIVAANPVSNPALTSNVVSAKPIAAPVLKGVPSPTRIDLNWGTPTVAGAIDYTVYQSTDPAELGSALPVVTTTTLARTGLTNGTTYYFRVQAHNSNGVGPMSMQLSVTPLAAPTLTVASQTESSVTLSWTADPSAISYEIYRTTYGNSFGTTPFDTSTTNSYTDSSVVLNGDYQYRVRVVNPTPNALLTSSPVRVKVLAAAVVSTVAGNRQITVKYPAVPNATVYFLYVSTIPGEIGVPSGYTSALEINYGNGSLTNGQTYYFTIRSFNYTGPGPYSAQVSGVPIPAATLSVTGLSSTSVSLSWTEVAGATGGYQIFRALNSESFGTTPLATIDAASPRSYTDSTVSNNTIYKYKVRAGNSLPNPFLDSNGVLALPIGIPVVTPVPGVSQVTLKWDAVPGVTGYRTYQSEVAGTQGQLMQTISGSPATRTSLDNHKTYYFTVVPYNSTGTGQPSEQVSAIPRPVPGVVNPVTLTPGDGQIGISFPAMTYATQYRIYRATASNGYTYTTPTLTVDTTGTGTITALDTGLTNATTYYYVVRSANPGGNSGSSTQVSATTLAKPVAPTLSAVAGNAQVVLSWGTITGATSYTLKRSETAGGPYTTVSSSLTGTSYTNTGLTNFTNYYYVLAGNNASGVGAFSNEVEATPRIAPVAAPSNLVLTTNDRSVTLTWDAVPTATAYKLVRSTTPGNFTGSEVATIVGTTFTDTGLQHNMTYYYQVRGTNPAGDGPAASGSITVYANLRFDAIITLADAEDWRGSGVYNATGLDQTAESSPYAGQTEAYQIVIKRSGGASGNAPVRVTLPDWSDFKTEGWTANIFNDSDNSNITLAITDDVNDPSPGTVGWLTSLAENQEIALRLEVKAPTTASIGKTKWLLVRATEVGSGQNIATDTVKAFAIVSTSSQPDIMVRPIRVEDTPWTGEFVYDGSEQKLSVVAVANNKRSYEIRVKNVTSQAQSFNIQLPAVATGWTEELFSGLASTTNVTNTALTTGWPTPQIEAGESISLRLEITGGTTGSTQREVAIKAIKASDSDTVKVLSEVQSIAKIQWSRDYSNWADVLTTTLLTIDHKETIGLRAEKLLPNVIWPEPQLMGPTWSWQGSTLSGETVSLQGKTVTGITGETATAQLGTTKSVQIEVVPSSTLDLAVSHSYLLSGVGQTALKSTVVTAEVTDEDDAPQSGMKVKMKALNETGEIVGSWSGNASTTPVFTTGADGKASGTWVSDGYTGKVTFDAVLLDRFDQPRKVKGQADVQTSKPYAEVKLGEWVENNGVWTRSVKIIALHYKTPVVGRTVTLVPVGVDIDEEITTNWQTVAVLDSLTGVTNANGEFSTIQHWNPVVSQLPAEYEATPGDYQISVTATLN